MVVLSSKVPMQKLLEFCGYQQTEKAGVYRSEQAGFRFVDLVLLNQLKDTPYNAPYKLFTSRQKEKGFLRFR